MHARPAPGAGRTVGKRVLGTLGAVALTAGLLSACGDQEEPPSDAGASSAPAESSPGTDPGSSAEPGAGEPTAGEDGTDGSDGAEGSGEPTDDGTTAEPSDDPSDAGDGAGNDEDGTDDEQPGKGSSQGDEQSGGKGDGKGENEGKGDGKDSAEEEKPDYVELGETGERVSALQQRLQDLGYFVTSVDGAFGSETQQAVFALQKAGGLYRDGVVGDVTQQAADKGVVPRAQTSSGKVLEIDIDRQLVLAVENGKVVKIINASSGNGETYEAKGATYTAYTPRGSFAVYREENRMYSSSLELGDMWRPKFFTGGIAVHGSASVPAFPASHGCVRVSNSAMDWIWDTWGAPSGTPVVVY
ncbi:L,D-transpeptidase family protein [Promicromonospora sp. NPDC052451]|uniref:L,D-transpeptidase family protein n=1 Tax=Promicromonospora sp. NPDC052451 TaxID=3364407 RepID=UPI0037C7AE1C